MEFTANQKMDAILEYLNKIYEETNIISYALIDNETIEVPKEPVRKTRDKYEIMWGAILKDEEKNERKVVTEFVLILEYLVNVECFIEKINDEYKILWKGKVFIENGGFEEKSNRDNAAAIRQATEDLHNDNEYRRNKYQYWVTVVIGLSTFVAAVYYFFQLYDGKQHQCIAVATLGLSFSVVIWLAVLQHREKEE